MCPHDVLIYGKSVGTNIRVLGKGLNADPLTQVMSSLDEKVWGVVER